MKIRSAFSFALRAVLGGLALYTVPWLIGAAHAATGDIPVPPPTPDALMAYVQNYGWIVGCLTGAYLAAKWLLKKNESTHWLAQGRALAVVTLGVGVAGTALQAYTAGTPWSGVLATALLGLLHLADAQVTPVRAAQGGFARLSVLLMLGAAGVALFAAAGCHPGSAARQTTASGVVAALDCEAAHLDAQALDDAKLFAGAKVQGWLSGVKPGDIDTLKARIAADLAPIKSDLGRCAITGALAAATAVLAPQPGAAVQGLTEAGPDPVQVRAAFGIAARAAGWAPVRVAGGAVL